MYKKKIKIVTTIITSVVVITTGSILGYSRWSRSPNYSVQQLIKAIITRDVKKAERYADFQKLAISFHDYTTASRINKFPELSALVNRENSLISTSNLMNRMKDFDISGNKEIMRVFIEKRNESLSPMKRKLIDDMGPWYDSTLEGILNRDYKFLGIESIEYDTTSTVIVTINLLINKKPNLLKITMIRKLVHWQVVEINNLEDIWVINWDDYMDYELKKPKY